MSDFAKAISALLFTLAAILFILFIWVGDDRWLRTAAVPASAALFIMTASSIGAHVRGEREARKGAERLP